MIENNSCTRVSFLIHAHIVLRYSIRILCPMSYITLFIDGVRLITLSRTFRDASHVGVRGRATHARARARSANGRLRASRVARRHGDGRSRARLERARVGSSRSVRSVSANARARTRRRARVSNAPSFCRASSFVVRRSVPLTRARSRAPGRGGGARAATRAEGRRGDDESDGDAGDAEHGHAHRRR